MSTDSIIVRNEEIEPSIIMLRRNMEEIPKLQLPTGFYFKPMYLEDVSIWTDIWRELESSDIIKDELFQKEFGTNWDIIKERCFLIFDKEGRSGGTISAWFDNSFKEDGAWGRIHWVALRKAYQGQGLAKPMLSMAMNIIAKNYSKCYLVTQYYRIPAIKLYFSFGFVPYINTKKARIAWNIVAKEIKHPLLETALQIEDTKVN